MSPSYGWLQFLQMGNLALSLSFVFPSTFRYFAMHDAWAKPDPSPRQAQLRISLLPFSSGPSSRHIQHDAPSGAIGDLISLMSALFLWPTDRVVVAFDEKYVMPLCGGACGTRVPRRSLTFTGLPQKNASLWHDLIF